MSWQRGDTPEKDGEQPLTGTRPATPEGDPIAAEAPLDISTASDVIVISQVRNEQRTEKFKDGVEVINKRYAGVFRRLAD